MIDPLDPTTLKAAREAAGLSRAELAAASSVHETTILRIEKGEVDPRLDGTWVPLVRAVEAATKAKQAKPSVPFPARSGGTTEVAAL